MSHQQLYKLPPLSQGRANGTSSSVAAANGGGDGDKIRQLQRLLLGVTKAIQTYLLEDIATVMESIHDMDDVKRYLSVVKCIARVNQHLAELPVPDAFAYEEPPFSAGSEEFVSFQRRMHYALWLIHAKLHVLPPFIVSTDGPAQLVALAKALKIAKAELQTFAVQLSELDALSEPAAGAAAAAAAAAAAGTGGGGGTNGSANGDRRRADGSDDDGSDDDGSGRKPRRRGMERSPESSSSDLEEDDDDDDDDEHDGERAPRAAPAEQQPLPPPIDHLTRRSSSDDLFRTKVRSNDASSSGEEAADDSRSGDLKHHIKNVNGGDDDDEVANFMGEKDDAAGSLSSSSHTSSTSSTGSSSSDDDDDDDDDDDVDDDDDEFGIEGGVEVVFVDDDNDNDDAIVVIDGSPPRVAPQAVTTVVDERPLSPIGGATALPARAASPKMRTPSPGLPAAGDEEQEVAVGDDADVPGSPGDATSEASFLRRGKPKRAHRRSPSQLSTAAKVSPSTSDDGEALSGSRVARSRLSTVITAAAAAAAADESRTTAPAVGSASVASTSASEPVVLVRTPTPPVVLDASGQVDAAATLRKSASPPSHNGTDRHPSPRQSSPRASLFQTSSTPPPLPPTPTEDSPPPQQQQRQQQQQLQEQQQGGAVSVAVSGGRARHARSLSLDTGNHNSEHSSPERDSPLSDAMHRELMQLRERVGELERSNHHYSASTKSSSSSSSLSVSSDGSSSSSGSSSDDDSNDEKLPPRTDRGSAERRRNRRRRRSKVKRMDTLDTMTPPDITPRVTPPNIETVVVQLLTPTVCLRAPFG